MDSLGLEMPCCTPAPGLLPNGTGLSELRELPIGRTVAAPSLRSPPPTLQRHLPRVGPQQLSQAVQGMVLARQGVPVGLWPGALTGGWGVRGSSLLDREVWRCNVWNYCSQAET